MFFFFQAEDGIRDAQESRGLGDVYKRQVLDRAQHGSANALSVLNYTGEVQDHPVCRTVLDAIGAGKRGSQVRVELSASPYGWPQDAVDASLAVLVLTGHVIATDSGQALAVQALNQTRIAKADFRRAGVVIPVSYTHLTLPTIYSV